MTWHHNDEVEKLNLVERSDHGDNHGIPSRRYWLA
ncbi:hypothetical protein [Burkholderia latens]